MHVHSASSFDVFLLADVELRPWQARWETRWARWTVAIQTLHVSTIDQTTPFRRAAAL